MNPFAIARPTTYEQAAALLTDKKYALPVIKGGGMDLVDLMKEGLLSPDLLVDVRELALIKLAMGEPAVIAGGGDQVTIAGAATLSDLAGSIAVEPGAAVLSQAAGSAATPQVRNVATIAGNLLQRPRCWYFRHAPFDCLKKGGHTCYAVEGENRYHAIFGDGPCHIVHPSNLAVALMVCDAVVHLKGGDRDSIPIADLFHMPDRGLRDEHELKPTEIITYVTCRGGPHTGFYAIKEKQSFDWPLAMAAVNLTMDGDRIADARICAGAVAPVPWPLPNVAAALKGVSVDDDAALRKACARAVEGARPMSENAYKLKLLPVAVRRAVLRAAGRDQEAG